MRLWRRAPSTLELPAKRFAWRTIGPVCPADFNVMVRKSVSWNSYTFWWLVKKWLVDWTRKWIHRKEIHWRFSTRISPEMLLLVFACLHQPAGSSHLPHISAGSHSPGGSHISVGPHISVGFHRPWGSHHKPWGSHPHHQKFHPIQHEPSHPGYQTNIVIDPYAKVSLGLGAQFLTCSTFITFPKSWQFARLASERIFLENTFDMIVQHSSGGHDPWISFFQNVFDIC